MLEALVISSVFQSLPTIYPISIEPSSSSDPHQYPPKQEKKKRRMERVKNLKLENRAAFPSSLFAKTAGIFDNMMCCRSYAEQQLSGEALEREREYKEEVSPGCGLDSVTKGKRDLFRNKMVAPVRETNRLYDFNNGTRQYDFVDETRSPTQPNRKGKTAGGRNAPHSPIGSSYSTATTVTANTYNTADYTTEDSCSLRSSSRSLRAETHELFMRDSPAEQSNRSLTNRTISVPSRSRRPIELDSEKRRWSEGCVEFEQQQQQHHADQYPYVPSEEVIRKVQSESLVELPYLSMTEGYRC
jgi:hypothetical protein